MAYEKVVEIGGCLGPSCSNYDALAGTCDGSVRLGPMFTSETRNDQRLYETARVAMCNTSQHDIDNRMSGPIVLQGDKATGELPWPLLG